MKKALKFLFVALLSSAMIFGFASCSDDDESLDVSVTDTSASRSYNYLYEVTGTVNGTEIKNGLGKVSWTVDPLDISNCTAYNIIWSFDFDGYGLGDTYTSTQSRSGTLNVIVCGNDIYDSSSFDDITKDFSDRPSGNFTYSTTVITYARNSTIQTSYPVDLEFRRK